MTRGGLLCCDAAICSVALRIPTPPTLTDSANTNTVDILSVSINTLAGVVEAEEHRRRM